MATIRVTVSDLVMYLIECGEVECSDPQKLVSAVSGLVTSLIRQEREQEREACAKVCESISEKAFDKDWEFHDALDKAAQAIRAL